MLSEWPAIAAKAHLIGLPGWSYVPKKEVSFAELFVFTKDVLSGCAHLFMSLRVRLFLHKYFKVKALWTVTRPGQNLHSNKNTTELLFMVFLFCSKGHFSISTFQTNASGILLLLNVQVYANRMMSSVTLNMCCVVFSAKPIQWD